MILTEDGAEIVRQLLTNDQLSTLRSEAERLSATENSASIRHVCAKSAVFHALAKSTQLHKLLRPNMVLVRSILFDKTPSQNWPVAWHQDITIAVREKVDLPSYGPWSLKSEVVHVQPPAAVLETMITLRIHLDDAPATNGALKVIPGSHLHGKLSLPEQENLLAISTPEICVCQAGDILKMVPLILHASSRSEAPSHRRVLHLEYAAPNALDPALSWHDTIID